MIEQPDVQNETAPTNVVMSGGSTAFGYGTVLDAEGNDTGIKFVVGDPPKDWIPPWQEPK